MDLKTLEINITGIVQGVGFRPFLFNLARSHNLKGHVLNRGNAGVRLVLQGKDKDLQDFLNDIEKERPEISYIEEIMTIERENEPSYKKLSIQKSEQGRGISLTLPPDIATCDECLKDMRNPNLPKYYQYPFIACAVCGPRYTTVKELPYDRERSTMIEFPLCEQAEPESCLKEYSDFNNRRFHAQTFACSVCGPNYSLYGKNRKKQNLNSIDDILSTTAERINAGEVAAVKGIGGVHLVCLADEDEIIDKLRKRKGGRKYKPFALMVPDLETINNDFTISKKEREIITSFRRPIVLLEKKQGAEIKNISENVAPGLNNIGFMLPYTGIHHLLFDYIGKKPLVYTSGNKSNIPMGIDNDKIIDQLSHLADFFLLHDRAIHQRADDSVLRIHDEHNKLIRRSRGYVPEYLPLPFKVEIPGALATGPELAVTGAVLRRNRIFPTQHIGNVSHLETHEFLKDALFHMKGLLQIKDAEIKFIACDAHPAFITTRYAKDLSKEFEVPLYPVQHHFAHVLGLMAENKVKLNERIIGISTDGVGYGEDGNVWGGEILSCSYEGYERLGHLQYQPMIGGDRCAKYPARTTASIILNSMDIEDAIKLLEDLNIARDLEYKNDELNALISQFKLAKGNLPNQNIPLSSSTGRIFDCVSYLLGCCNLKTYRGEPAMRLEGLAASGKPNKVKLEIQSIKKGKLEIINTSRLILDIIRLAKSTKSKPQDIAAKFQLELGKAFSRIAIKEAKKHEIQKVGLTGGVAYNHAFSRAVKDQAQEAGHIFLEHSKVAPGDAGISSGQLIGGLTQYLSEKE